MFDFGFGSSEILVIAVVALIVLGPKDLPRLLHTIGQYMRKIQGMAREFQNHLNEAAKEAGVEDVKKEVKGMTNFTVTADLDKQGSEIKRAIEQSAATAASNGAGGKEEAEKPAPAALARPIAATEPVAPPKAKPVRQKAEAKPKPAAKTAAKTAAKPAAKTAPKPKAKSKADTARDAAKP